MRPTGDDKGTWLATLEAGASRLQGATLLHGCDVYVVGFHCARSDPRMQMEAHHYCKVVNDELLQCAIFDGNTRSANLIGIEYIIAERLFENLPAGEEHYWYPHNHEMLSGELVAPGLPDAAGKALMKQLMNSYGKTWHTWHTGRHDGEPGDALPLGEPQLMWSFNRSGECDDSLRQSRDDALRVDTAKKRDERRSLAPHAHPQHGVDAMDACFTDTTSIAGVVDWRTGE